jgi:nicotinate phosphoribosyltransferase
LREEAMRPEQSVLLTDLYQLTMLQAYYLQGLNDVAVFEMFVRRLPAARSFLMAAGLEQVLDYLESLRFTSEELQWLRETGRFRAEFVDYLAELRFTGDVAAMPEGTVFFADEPLIRVVAPLAEAQLVESRIINLLQFQTMIASKASRCRLAAPAKSLVDFGMRRAHGAEAALLAARATYLAGFNGTATVLAGMQFGIPIFGTMAHSYVLAHDDEAEAFERFAECNPREVVMLLDTYGVESAAAKVVNMAPRLRSQGISIHAVRLDSGDLEQLARRVRRILDEGGLTGVRILASGNLDEYGLRDLLASGAPLDGFGVGTRLDVCDDAPYLECAYKLQEYAGAARRKRSEGKANWPGRKQVCRHFSEGIMCRDEITPDSEPCDGEPLLQPVMRHGRRLAPSPSLPEIQQRAIASLAQLPAELRQLEGGAYDVQVSPAIRELASQLDRAAP